MKTAKDLLDELDGGGSQDDREDWLAQRMRTAHQRVWDTQLPMIDTQGVPPDEGPWEDSWGKRIARGLTGLEDVIGLGLKALGANIKGRVAQEDEQFNNFVRDIYKDAGREDTPPPVKKWNAGEWASGAGDYLFNRAHSPEREKAFRPNNRWQSTDLLDLVKSPSKLADYMTDTGEGFLYDLPYNTGDILGFLLAPKGVSGAKATRFAGEILNPASGLLGRLGYNRAADVIGSKAAREALGASAQFGATMGPYGAMVNSGTIIDELKKQGKSDAEIADAMGELFREELPADVAFAALTGNVLKGKLGNVIAPRGSSLGRKIAANAAGIPLESAGGYLSNVNQMILSEKYSGQPYGELFGEHTPAEKQAGLMGAMAGLPFAVYGGGRGVVDARAADKAYERFQEYIAEGKDQREAALQDMPQMARDAYRDAQNEYSSNNLRAWAQSQGVPDDVYNLAAKVAQEEGVPVERVIATIMAESNGDQSVISPAGAIGVMQLIPETAEALGVDPYDLEQNIRGGVRYLKQQYNRFGDWDLAHAAYNAGEGALYDENGNFRGIPPYAETQNYVATINNYLGEVGSGEAEGVRGGYVGEGGKGEGTYWVRNDGVSFDGAQPQLMDAMDMLGKKFYDDTGVQLVVSAGTNGDHPSNGSAHGHDAGWKVDIVDAGANGVGLDANGALFNSDFTPTEYCKKFIEYGRSLGLGMNLEGVGTPNVHLDVALDGTQWDGNGDHAGGFNPKNGDMRSDVQRRADELFDQRFRERVTPQRQEEPPMQARQIDLNDSGLHDAFARDRMTAAIDNNDADAAGFWGKMFDGDAFKNTDENRAAVRQRYGTELEQFAQTYEPATVQAEQQQTVQTPTPRAQGQGQTQQQQAQPQQQKPTTKNTSNKYIRNNDVLQAGNNFLEELRAKGTQADMATTVRLQAAISSGDTATVENILKANNRPIVAEQQTTQAQPQQQTQTQTEPVKQNQPPENIIQQDTPQEVNAKPLTAEQKRNIRKVNSIPDTKVSVRRQQGEAVLALADENGIEIPAGDREALRKGGKKILTHWRNELIKAGVNLTVPSSNKKSTSTVQSSQQQQTQQQTQEAARPAEKPLTLQERAQQIVNKATEAAGQNWEDIKRGYQERGRVAKSDQSIIEQQADDDFEDSLYRDDAEEERQAKAEQRQIRDDKQNDDNFEAELPTLRQAQYWLYDNGNEQAAREMEDAIRERSLYKAHLIADRTNVPQEILPRIPQRSDAGRRATPVQNPGTEFAALVTKARQYQNILLEDGDTQGAQAIEDAIQNRDEAALRDLPTTREEISAREEQARREKQDREVEVKRHRQEDDAINAALSTPSADEFARKKQGAGILKLMNSQSFKDTYGTIELPPGLEQALQNGRRKGIEAAQDLLRKHGVTERTENPEAAKERGQQQRDAYYEDELDAESEMLDSRIEEEARDERVARLEEEEARDAESERLEARMDDAEALEELFDTESERITAQAEERTVKPQSESRTEQEATPKEEQNATPRTEEQKTESTTTKEKAGSTAKREKVTPQDLAKEFDRIEDHAKAHSYGDIRNEGAYVLSNFAQATKDALAKILPLDKFPNVRAKLFDRIDDALLEGLHKFKKSAASCIRSFETLRKVCEDVFNDAYSVVGREDILSRKEGEIARNTPNVKYTPSEKISETEVLSDEQDAGQEPSQAVSKLADKIKKLLTDRLGLSEALQDRLSSMVDGLARRAGDNVAKFKAACRTLIADANSGQLNAQFDADERASWVARTRGRRNSSSSPKDPQAGAKAKARADKLKADIENLLPQLDKYPNLKADIFKVIDIGVDFASKTGKASKFGGWASRYLTSLKDLVKEKSKTKEGIEGWLEQQERQLSGQKESTDVPLKETKPAEAKTEEKPKPETKSMEGEADTRITNVIEDESTLTPLQKLLQSFSKKLGVPIQFFRNPDGKFHGSFSNGVLFLNVNSKKGLGGVFWHESFHWLKANNPKLYAKLIDAAGITDKDRQAFLDRTGRKDLKTNEEIDEEILADQMDDVAKRTGLLQSIAGKNRGVIERVVQWLKDTMNKFIETFRNPTGRLTTKQAQALAKEFGQIARQLKDENGEQIFRVNNRTGDIEVVEGRKARELSSEEIEAAAKSSTAKYSVDTNDNGSESLGQKIKNFASTVFNGKPQSKNHKQFIVDKLEELTRYKTYFNTNAKNEADVIVDSFQKIIRARHAYDFEKLLPATGEPIAKVLGLNPSAEMSNYIADWMMTGAINNTSKEATAFQKAMRAHPAEAELLQSIRDTFQEMANMTAEEAVESNIVRDKKSKTFREWLGEKFSKEEWVDDLHPIVRAYDQTLAKAPPAVADIIKKNFDPYMSASLFRGKGAIADMMIGDKKEVTDEDVDIVRRVLQREFPNVNFSDFKPLAAIAKMVDYDVEGLERYALAKLDKEMHEKKNSGDAKYANLTPSYTEAQCDEIIKAGKAKYDAAQRALVDYSNTLAAIQYSTGVISANQFYQRVNGWENFVPTARVFEEYEDISVDKSDSSKHKTGSKRRVYAPLGKLEDNTNLFIRQALQNRARLEIVTMARLGNFGDIFAETPKGYPQGHTIHFKENGKMKYLVTPDESLARAVEAIQTPADANIVVQAFKTAGMIMRGLYTMFNAEFMVGNPFRDLADAFIHNKYGSRNPFVAIPAMVSAAVSGLAQSVGAKIKTEEFRTFLAEGGAQSGFSYEVTEGASRRVNSFGKKSLAKSTWDKFLMIAEASENMTRFSTFKTAKDNLAKQHGGVPTPHDLKLAAMQARRATVDFARAGRTMRGVNKVALFSNAAMQSLALWGETINAARKGEEGALGELFTKIFKTVMGGVMPALAFAALNFSDDDRRKSFEQRHTWEKDTYWIFGDGLRVPKGMDLGIKLTSALTEEFAMWLASNKPVEWKRIVNNIGRGLPSITTTIFTPAVESYMNYSIFKDAPIVPYGQQDDPKYKQYGKNTSWVAKQLGNMFNQSPRQIDHLIAGYGGSMFTALTGGSDGIPVVRRFMFDPDKNPRIVQDYYKALEEQEEMLAEYKARRADGEKVELPEDYDRGLHARLKKSREAMTKISKAEMRIMDDPKLDADKRKEKLRELEKRRVALCERVLGKAR